MSSIITGIVTNGVIVTNSPLPEGARVEIRMQPVRPEVTPELQEEFGAWERAGAGTIEMVERVERLTPAELRRMPREQRQAILATAAELAEPDYRSNKELTGFEAFSEEELDDDESDSR